MHYSVYIFSSISWITVHLYKVQAAGVFNIKNTYFKYLWQIEESSSFDDDDPDEEGEEKEGGNLEAIFGGLVNHWRLESRSGTGARFKDLELVHQLSEDVNFCANKSLQTNKQLDLQSKCCNGCFCSAAGRWTPGVRLPHQLSSPD